MRLGTFILTYAAILFCAFSIVQVPGSWTPLPSGLIAPNDLTCLDLHYEPNDAAFPARIVLDSSVLFARDSVFWFIGNVEGDDDPSHHHRATAWSLASQDSIDVTVLYSFIMRLPRYARSGTGRVMWRSHINIFAALVEPDFHVRFERRQCGS